MGSKTIGKIFVLREAVENTLRPQTTKTNQTHACMFLYICDLEILLKQKIKLLAIQILH